MIFRQLLDPRSSTYTYLLADGGEGVLIDPVFEHARRDRALAAELGVALRFTIDTHVHADHVTAAWLHQRTSGARIAVGGSAGVSGADTLLGEGDRVPFGARHLAVRETPGHTGGCITLVLDDESMAFTGDTLMVRAVGRTDFQEGDAATMYRSVHGRLFSLPNGCLVYPGHDYQGRTVTTIGEERRFNPRLGGDRNVEDFIGYMKNLGLAHPNQMDVAVPANLRCGRPETDSDSAQALADPKGPAWAPLTYSFAGVWEVDARWVGENAARRTDLQILDVREPAEWNGDLGHIAEARLLPLGELASGMAQLDKARPIVAVCRSGARSAQATVLLARAGFSDVANLAGGMIRWRALGLPVADARR